MQSTCRLFIAASAIAPMGCGISISRDEGIPVAAPMPMPTVRSPQIGQEWRYIERYFFSGQTRGIVVETISNVGKTITVSCTYEYVVALRAVQTQDFMTAHWAHLPHELLGKVSNRIINEVRGINRVVFDISGKPPSTIEWE